jgi:excisionase family DNA binding protein
MGQQSADMLHVTQTEPTPTAPIEPLAVGIADAATVVGVSPSTIKREIVAGNLPSFRLGGRRLIEYAALRTFVDRLTAV